LDGKLTNVQYFLNCLFIPWCYSHNR